MAEALLPLLGAGFGGWAGAGSAAAGASKLLPGLLGAGAGMGLGGGLYSILGGGQHGNLPMIPPMSPQASSSMQPTALSQIQQLGQAQSLGGGSQPSLDDILRLLQQRRTIG